MTTRAVVRGDRGPPEIREVPVPRPDEDEVLVRVRAVGLAGAAGPCGYAGTVEAVGSRVTKELRKGDRIAGVARGAADGVDLAEYVAAKGDLQMAIPDGLGDEEAAALGGPLSAVCQAYAALQLPLPPTSWFAPQSILIHGGATPVGRLGIQFARRSGLTVLATRGGRSGSSSSSRRRRGAGEKGDDDEDEAAALRELGAAAVFDAAAPACAAEIRAQTRDRLTLAWDCTGGRDDDEAALCAAALSATEPGVYYATPSTGSGGGTGGSGFDLAAVNPRAAPPRAMPAGVAAAAARVYYRATTTTTTTTGDADADPADADPADAEDAYELARGFWACAQALLESGDLAAPPPAAGALEVNRGGAGLEGVLRGLEALQARREGGEEEEEEEEEGGPQLVYTL